jgi:hypothetical protein
VPAFFFAFLLSNTARGVEKTGEKIGELKETVFIGGLR